MPLGRYVQVMIVVVAALKGGVGKTTTAVHLAALAAAGRREATLVDADPQASAADWLDTARRTPRSSRSTWSRRPPNGC